MLKKRSLLSVVTIKSLKVGRGEQFANWGVKAIADGKSDIIQA